MGRRLEINRVERFRDGHKFDCTILSFWRGSKRICFTSDGIRTLHFDRILSGFHGMVTNHEWAMQLYDAAKLFEQALEEKEIE